MLWVTLVQKVSGNLWHAVRRKEQPCFDFTIRKSRAEPSFNTEARLRCHQMAVHIYISYFWGF